MKKVLIYADGSSIGNPGPGGWCGIIIYNNNRKVISGGEPYTTNNRMELTAVIESLEALKEPCEVYLYTDSNYVVQGLKIWLDNWMSKGWKTSSGKDVLNRDLWEKLNRLRSIHRIVPNWIKGHNKDPLNEECDRIAKREAMKFKG
ncbi:MAG: ribonuclease HI [Hydrogenothermaceae bacterium]|nr:ribonuclease HI [Hydrogenothermaceae bacterium]